MSNRDAKKICFKPEDFKGSRLRCLLLTSQRRKRVADFLNAMVAPHAEVAEDATWAPRGFLEPDEARLEQSNGILKGKQPSIIGAWWLADQGRNTPNWDLVSTCRTVDREGLILVEAKAHVAEFKVDGTGAKPPNRQSIEAALEEASAGLSALTPGSGFRLSAHSHYQLCNRFAFAWKLASMKIPTVLVYLGFLDCQEMGKGCFQNHEQWRACVVEHSENHIPKASWDRTFSVDGTPLTVLIRSATVDVEARQADSENPKTQTHEP